MTIPFCGDKIAHVADDGGSTPQKIKPAGDAEAEQPGGGRAEGEKPEALKKQMKKTVDNALQM